MTEDILHKIGSISRALDSIANIEFKDMNLNRGQYLYLVRIKQNPGIISDHLAARLCVDRTTAARSIQKLVKQELVFRKVDETNKKIKHLFVTQKGKQLANRIEAENNYSNKVALNGLNSDQIEELSELLSTLEENTRQDWLLVKNHGKRDY